MLINNTKRKSQKGKIVLAKKANGDNAKKRIINDSRIRLMKTVLFAKMVL